MASGHKSKDSKVKQHSKGHKAIQKDEPAHPHVSHEHAGDDKVIAGPVDSADEYVTVSGRALLIGLVVVLAVALLVWKFQSGPAETPLLSGVEPADSVQDEVIATVNGESIFRSRVQGQLDQLTPDMRAVISFDEVLNSTINEAVILQEAKRLGIDVSPAEANAYLVLTLNQSGVARDELVSRAEARGLKESDIIDIFRRRLIVNELLQTEVFPGVEVGDEEAMDWYKENKAALAMPELVEAKHILLAQPEEANATLDRIRRGAKFEDLARDLSLDKASAMNGGDLGNFTRGMMVPEFEDAAWDVKVGAIAGPVKTQFGYHIIKIVGHHKGRDRSFSELKDDIRNKLKVEKAETAADGYVKKLRDNAQVEWLAKPEDSRPASSGFPPLEDLDEDE